MTDNGRPHPPLRRRPGCHHPPPFKLDWEVGVEHGTTKGRSSNPPPTQVYRIVCVCVCVCILSTDAHIAMQV